jgi:hypothetical protein
MIFGPRGVELIGDRKKAHDEELQDLQSSTND